MNIRERIIKFISWLKVENKKALPCPCGKTEPHIHISDLRPREDD